MNSFLVLFLRTYIAWNVNVNKKQGGKQQGVFNVQMSAVLMHNFLYHDGERICCCVVVIEVSSDNMETISPTINTVEIASVDGSIDKRPWGIYVPPAIEIAEDHDSAKNDDGRACLLYTSPSPRDLSTARMPSSA